MPSLQDLQRGNSRLASEPLRVSHSREEEHLVTDDRSQMSPAQCVEEKLSRLLQRSETTLSRAFLSRRPR
jgi:hypothetical protein